LYYDCYYKKWLPIFPRQFHGIQLVSNSLVSSLQLLYGEVRAGRPPKHNPTKLHCVLTQCPPNPEASCTNVSEEILYTWRPCQSALRPARHRSCWCPMGQGHPCLPNPPLTQITLGQLCATPCVSRPWPPATEPGLEPTISSGTASTAMQCLRLPCHSGGASSLLTLKLLRIFYI
jgi:hypothetical protein